MRVTNFVFTWNFGLENTLSVVLCFPGVYCQWLSEFDGVPQLPSKNILLDVPRGVIVVIIQPYLTPTDTSWVCHGF